MIPYFTIWHRNVIHQNPWVSKDPGQAGNNGQVAVVQVLQIANVIWEMCL
jgi:hypothetical protein